MIENARNALGPVGACLPASLTSALEAAAQGAAVGRLERAGYRAIWANEVLGKDVLVQLAMLLSATGQTVFGTCIANIWVRPAQTMHAAAAQLAQAHPGKACPWPGGRVSGAGGGHRAPLRQSAGHHA